jgi:hypothetical protein
MLSGMLGIVDSVATIDTLATNYNFEVEQTHNYFVGTGAGMNTDMKKFIKELLKANPTWQRLIE